MINFSPGPAMLPDPVRERVGREWLNGLQRGCSIAEISHRGCEFLDLAEACEIRLRQLLGLKQQQQILFMQGGATTQFTLLPMNFGCGGYLVNGHWSRKAYQIACGINSNTVLLGESQADGRFLPLSAPTQHLHYVHLASNETIHGIQWPAPPAWLMDFNTPLVADMSSDIASRQMDYSQFAMAYAGTQKNLGIAGLTLVIIKQDLLQQACSNLPVMLQYQKFAQHDSMFNTPPTFTWYVTDLVLQWLQQQGGVQAIEQANSKKSQAIYSVIDKTGFYSNDVDLAWRSKMNIAFYCATSKLDDLFVQEAVSEGMQGLKGHRAIGGLRASLYNAMPMASVETLVSFMQEFERRHG